MMTGRKSWKCRVHPKWITVEHTCHPEEADVDEFSMTIRAAEELRDLLNEMLPPVETCLRCGEEKRCHEGYCVRCA